MTADELMERLSRLRRAQIGGKRAPHKPPPPLLLLWLFGRLASTGSARASYADAAGPVNQLINDFGPPVRSPALERQRAAMPFVHLERDLWDLRDSRGGEIPLDAPETGRWLLDHDAVGQLRPEVTAVLADAVALAAAARLLLDQLASRGDGRERPGSLRWSCARMPTSARCAGPGAGRSAQSRAGTVARTPGRAARASPR
jgi:putative restriction endonuclease